MNKTARKAAIISDPIGELGVLCNVSVHNIFLDGQLWPSVEHYFQAQKFLDSSLRDRIRETTLPLDAKSLAWRLQTKSLRPDWSRVRLSFMAKGVRAKCQQNRDVAETLRHTWPLPIFEDSLEDAHWGIGKSGKGKNWAGRVLMKIREEAFGLASRTIPHLAQRFPHQPMSRYETVHLNSDWPMPVPMHAGNSNWLRSTKLTTCSIPQIIRRELHSAGVEWPSDVGALPTVVPQTLGHLLALANPARTVPELIGAILDARQIAYDEKYGGYHWAEDARALFPDWELHFRNLISEKFGPISAWQPAIVIGAGSGEEALHLWKAFGHSVILTDVGHGLVENCRRQAPKAVAHQLSAENLHSIPTSSVGLYCALRVYESAFFDRRAAILEARRVLRPGGGILISLSNGYQGIAGQLVPGRLIDDGKLDPSAAVRDVSSLVSQLREAGFQHCYPVDLETEWAIVACRGN